MPEQTKAAKQRIEEAKRNMKDGLPIQAFAVAVPEDSDTWHFPHHSKAIIRALEGRVALEKTVDWNAMAKCVEHFRIPISPEEKLFAAKHLAAHYLAAGKGLPDILAALN